MACGEPPRQTSGAPSGPCPEERQPASKMTMAKAISQHSTQNRKYVRRLLREKQPGFSAALELAMDLAGRELRSRGDAARRQRFRGLVTSNVRPLGTAADVAQAIAGQLHFIRSAGVHEDRSSSYPGGGFARDFAAAGGERVRVEALTRRQFADLATTTRLARTVAFLERVLDVDFSAPR